MATPTKGIDVRQTGTALLLRASLKTPAGTKLTVGPTTLQLARLSVVGVTVVAEGFDFADNTFKTTLRTTPTLAMNPVLLDAGGYGMGVWTAQLSALNAFAPGDIILAQVSNLNAFPVDQEREFQYGGDQGDLVTFPVGTGQAWLGAVTAGYTGGNSPEQKILSAVIESGFSFLKVMQILGGVIAGKTTGGPGGYVVRSLDDSRDILAGTSDASGNRLTEVFP